MRNRRTRPPAPGGGTPTYYCWGCYGEASRPAGRCYHCRREIAAPPNTDDTALLLWELWHPLPELQLRAACVLGRRGDERALAVLRGYAADTDPDQAHAALKALAVIETTTDSQAG